MAPLSVPPELKKITQFIRRAEELDRDTSRPESRLVAYYCRQHAVRIGIPLSSSSSESVTKCLGELLTLLEGEKEAMSVFSLEEARHISRKFAFEVFENADAQDRSGNANKLTAKGFYAAAVFLEILQHFDGDSNDENEKTESQKEEDEKRKYSKWKATEILKAIKEGREIVPGGYNTPVEDDTGPDAVTPPPPLSPTITNYSEDPSDHQYVYQKNNNINNTDVHVDDTNPPLNQGTEADIYGLPPPPYSGNKKNNDNDDIDNGNIPPMMPPYKFEKKGKVSKAAMEDAVELCRFAQAALENGDANLGATRLQQALQCLGRSL